MYNSTINYEDLVNTILYILLFMCLMWYIRYHWSRRRLYLLASKRNGPPTLPFIGNALCFIGSTGDFLDTLLRLSDRYESPVRVWIGQRLFFAIWQPKDLETIMNSPHALAKDALYKRVEFAVGTGLFTAPVPQWKRHRKVIMPTFNQKILDGFVEIFAEKSKVLLRHLKSEVGKGTVDIFNYISKYNVDVLCETVMGVTVDAQLKDFNYLKWTNRVMEILVSRMNNMLHYYDFIFNFTSNAGEMKDLISKMHKFGDDVIKRKRAEYQERIEQRKECFEEGAFAAKTFLQQLMELSEEGDRLTDEELRDEVNTLLIAGSDTTTSISCFIFVMLAMHPHVQDRVYKEVIDVLGPDRPVEYKDLTKFQYLERAIKETMRLFPAGFLLIRAITKDIELEKCTIPEGSSAVLLLIKLHRSEEFWPNPLKFDPDRFLPKEVSKRHPYSWLPFSGGPRNCVGLKYAMMSMKALVATVIRKYEVFTEYKSPADIKLEATIVSKPLEGYKLSVEYR